MTVSILRDAGDPPGLGAYAYQTDVHVATQDARQFTQNLSSVVLQGSLVYKNIYIKSIHPLEALMPRHPDASHSRLIEQVTSKVYRASVEDTCLRYGAQICDGNNM